jgi:RNA polymerase sigma-70 factor (ECF subfamily)
MGASTSATDWTEPGEPPRPVQPSASRDDQARLGRLLKSQFASVYRTLRRLGVTPFACEDAAQEAFLIVSQKLSSVAPELERSFLMGVVARVAANRRRSQATRREVGDPDLDLERAAGSQPLPDALIEKKRLRELLDRVLEALPSELRAVFVLVELEGMSAREIAESLDMPPGTVASRLRRARELFSEIAASVRAELDHEESSR